MHGRGRGEPINCDACARLCDADDLCQSMECSPSELVCNLNTIAYPRTGQMRDWYFCAKGVKRDDITGLLP